MISKAAVVVCNTLLLLVLIEAGAHIAERVHPETADLSFGYAPYRMLRMTSAPWPLNRDGFRAAEPETYRGKFLVEFLGGSVCLGVGTNPGPTVPERLEQLLHQAGMPEASVLNLCQGGATTGQELAILLQYGLPLEPQVVLSFNGANDLMHPAPVGDDDAPNLPYRNREMRSRFDGGHGWIEHLAVFRVAARLAKRGSPAPFQTLAAVPPKEILASYLYSTDAARTLVQARKGSYAVILQPTLHYQKPWSDAETSMWRERRPRDGREMSAYTRDLYARAPQELARWSKESGVPVYDLTQTFAATQETIYSDSVHFTGESGYRMLTEQLVKQGLLDQIAERYRTWQRQGSERSAIWPR